MFDISTFPTADAVRRAAQLRQEDYQRLYRQSIDQPDTFWAETGQGLSRLDKNPGTASSSQTSTPVPPQWFAGGQLNVSYNCIDRHLAQRADQPAFIWEGDDPSKSCHDYLPSTAPKRQPPGQRLEKPWCEQR